MKKDETMSEEPVPRFTNEEEAILLDAEEFIGTLVISNLFQVHSSTPSFPSENRLIQHTEGSMSIDEVPI